jgi:hypothetical protein
VERITLAQYSFQWLALSALVNTVIKLSGSTNVEKFLHQPRAITASEDYLYTVNGLQQRNKNLLILAPKLLERGQHYKPFAHNMSQNLLINKIYSSGDFNIFLT